MVGVGSIEYPIPKGFSSLLLKPYIKVLTHSEKVGWWKTLMVECVSLFFTIQYNIVKKCLHIPPSKFSTNQLFQNV